MTYKAAAMVVLFFFALGCGDDDGSSLDASVDAVADGDADSRDATVDVAGDASCESLGGTICDGECVNTDNDQRHCGGCGNSCGGDTPSCGAGECRLFLCSREDPCPGDSSCCGRICCDAQEACCEVPDFPVNRIDCIDLSTTGGRCPPFGDGT